MAKLSHPKDTYRFEPPGQDSKPEAERIAYHLRPPSVYDRVEVKKKAAARGARQWGTLDLIAQMRSEAVAVLAESDAKTSTRVLGILDKRRDGLSKLYEDMNAGAFEWDTEEGRTAFLKASQAAESGQEDFNQVEANIHSLGGRYAEMTGDNQVYLEILGIEAVRMLLTDWDNLGPFKRHGFQGVPEDVLARIPQGHLSGLGVKYLEMLAPTRAEEKNSASPSSGASARRTSPARKTPQKKARN